MQPLLIIHRWSNAAGCFDALACAIGQLPSGAQGVRDFFIANRTLFIDTALTRQQKDELFWIKSLADMV